MAQPRKIEELKKSAQQKVEFQRDEAAACENMRAKELEIAKEWEILRQLKETEMMGSSEALKEGLAVEKQLLVTLNATAGVKKKELMKYLKRQRKFLFLAGVPTSLAPLLQKKLPTGKKISHTPDEFCGLLGTVLDQLKTGTLDKDLKPIEPLAKKLEQFGAFRNASTTEQMKDFLASENDRMASMVEEVQRDVAAGIDRYRSRKATASKLKKTGKKKKSIVIPSKFKKGQTVWVVDENDLDPEAEEQVWKATVFDSVKTGRGNSKPGWWSLAFGTDEQSCYDYFWYNIFGSEEDAKTYLYS